METISFNSRLRGRDIYWVDARVIEDHRPEEPRAPVGDYLDLPPPGDTPVPFAPGLVNTEHADGCVGFGLEASIGEPSVDTSIRNVDTRRRGS